jgi:murein DD-endopeptidase MepM/ murein hydrolase activator NlpD
VTLITTRSIRPFAAALTLAVAALAGGSLASAQTPQDVPPPTTTEPEAAEPTKQKIDPRFGEQERGDDRDRDDDESERGGFQVRGGKSPTIRTSVDRKVFFYARKPARFRFSIKFNKNNYFEDHRVSAKIDLVRKHRGDELETWRVKVPGPGEQTVKWGGEKREDASKPASPGKYTFRVTPLVDGKAVKPKKKRRDSRAATFDFYTHIFPVDGKHDFGGKGARFGAGRGGRSHQGHDVFAKCGTPLRAARGGKVQANQFQSSAGFYVVIDGAKTDVDYVYMHLKKRSKFRQGKKVHTGEVIGAVGDSGNAHGCHLHFELWTGPGWFEGGKAYDPKPQLKGWDRFS